MYLSKNDNIDIINKKIEAFKILKDEDEDRFLNEYNEITSNLKKDNSVVNKELKSKYIKNQITLYNRIKYYFR